MLLIVFLPRCSLDSKRFGIGMVIANYYRYSDPHNLTMPPVSFFPSHLAVSQSFSAYYVPFNSSSWTPHNPRLEQCVIVNTLVELALPASHNAQIIPLSTTIYYCNRTFAFAVTTAAPRKELRFRPRRRIRIYVISMRANGH